MLQAAHISLVARQGWEGRGGRKRKGKMGWWHGFARLSGGQSRERVAWSRNRWYGCIQRWEKEREVFGCDVGVNSAAEAYTLHGRRRSLTACRFSEFIMNVLLFPSFSLTFLFSFTLFISPPSFLSSCHLPPLLVSEHHSHPPFPPALSSLSQTHVAYHPES